MLGKYYDAKEAEKRMQQLWEEEKIYEFKPDGREIYSIDTPPPTVSGSLHIGHIFSYTQAEIIARFQRMRGKNVFYPFGFDDNGLPSERLVEKQLKITAAKTPQGEFTRLCRETVAKYSEAYKQLWKSMGFSVDWGLKYETIGPLAQKISQASFIRLAGEGKAYRKETPVLWCSGCRTSIAQAELETAEMESLFNTIPFTVDGETIPVATTRPELLYGCVALFVHPDDDRYKKFIGKKAAVPVYGFEIPVIADDGADMQKGTGAVMCATFGDAADLQWYEKYKLEYKRVVEKDGRINGGVPYIGGLKVREAREVIISLLNERGLLIKSEKIRHTVSVHERCGKEIEIIPSDQWFIDILSQKERFIKAADEINWYPESMKTRYIMWVENLKWDWCISRQRHFGVPFPVWYCKNCGRTVFAQPGSLPVNPAESAPNSPCECGCCEFAAETAVMDTWATSSLSPFINARKGEKDELPLLPMSMRTQAHEIIRTWAFYTIVRSIYETGCVPWKDIMICGFVVAKKGEKMSKSKNNGAKPPEALIKEYSADILRYWSAGAGLGTDTMFSYDELKIAGRFITKLWNAARFALGALENYKDYSPDYLPPADEWIIARCSAAEEAAAMQLEKYETGAARREIDAFFWKDFCDNYVELVKGRLYGDFGEEGKMQALYTVYHVYLEILKMYAPYVPHVTDYIYQSFYREREHNVSVHTMLWGGINCGRNLSLAFGEMLKDAVSEVRKYKSAKGLLQKTVIALVDVTVPEEFYDSFIKTKDDFTHCVSCADIEIKAGEALSVKITE